MVDDSSEAANTSGLGKAALVPPEILGWSWGGFGLNWIWAIFNNTWIGLTVLVPHVGFIMCFVLGVKGNEWAWRNKKWRNVEHFKYVQKKWAIATMVFYLLATLISIVLIAMMIALDISFVTR